VDNKNKEIRKNFRILSKVEIKELYSIPTFTSEERLQYFTLDEDEHKVMKQRRSLESKIHFILQLGYFKHTPCFTKITWENVKRDTQYVIKTYFQGKCFSPKIISAKIQRKTQSDILELLKFTIFDRSAKQKLEQISHEAMTMCSDPRYVFDVLVHCLRSHNIILPGYSTLKKIIRLSFLKEEKRLAKIIENDIPQDVDKAFRQLLESEESIYGITIFKTDAKGFKNADIKAEIDKKTSSESLYNFAAKTLPKLKISRDNILYYASLVDYYSVDKLRELSYDNVRLYLLCYSFYRFQKTNDNLVNAFVYYVNSYQKKAKEVGKQDVYEYKSLKSDYFKKALELIELFVDKSIKGMTLFEKVRKKAFDIVKEEEFPALKQGLKGHVIDERKFAWDHYPKIAGLITRNLRPLARSINFEGDKPNDDLIIALEFLQKTFDTKKSLKKINQADFPTAFIPSNRHSYLYDSDAKDPSLKTINVHKYEFLVYEQLEAELSSGRIIVNNSTSFKSFSRDLTLIKTEEQRKNLLNDFNNPMLSTPIKIQLKEYQDILNPLISKVNQDIASGKNKSIKFKKNGTWSISYSGQKDEINNPFCGQFSQTSLINVLHFVNKHCNFLNFFPHIRPRYAKGEADEDGIYACLIAFATNHGIFQISQISDLNYNKLHSIFKNNIRLENLKNAADIVSDKIAELPMFKRWNLMDNLLFASLDGKKRQTKRQNIISRFSPKYFGRKRGVVCYSMIANHVCVNAKILGANEHESHYSFDMVQNQNTSITADYICGDDHSINSVNFVLFRLISSQFAPHLKAFTKRLKTFLFWQS